MKIVFRITQNQAELFKRLTSGICEADCVQMLTDIEALVEFDHEVKTGRFSDWAVFLAFGGSHTDFHKLVMPIRLIHMDNVGSIIRPILYKPDEIRLKWEENLEIYLENRATVEEYLSESSAERLYRKPPDRFIDLVNTWNAEKQFDENVYTTCA